MRLGNDKWENSEIEKGSDFNNFNTQEIVTRYLWFLDVFIILVGFSVVVPISILDLVVAQSVFRLNTKVGQLKKIPNYT